MMAPETHKKTWLQLKHIAIIIGVVSTLLFIASIVLITVGYLIAYSSLGLGILGAGAVVFFATEVFLCMGYIWVKNKISENDSVIIRKPVRTSTAVIGRLKPASNVTSPVPSITGDTYDGKLTKAGYRPVSLHYETSSGDPTVSPTSPEKLIPNSHAKNTNSGCLQPVPPKTHLSSPKQPSDQTMDVKLSQSHIDFTGLNQAPKGKIKEGDGKKPRKLWVHSDKTTAADNKPNTMQCKDTEKKEKQYRDTEAVHVGHNSHNIANWRKIVKNPKSRGKDPSSISNEKATSGKTNL